MAREEAHERVCTFLVSSDKSQASGKEIREALESSNDEAKVDALQKAVAALLAGEQLPALFITIVRYVLPSENHQVQKLLLLYLVRPRRLAVPAFGDAAAACRHGDVAGMCP